MQLVAHGLGSLPGSRSIYNRLYFSWPVHYSTPDAKSIGTMAPPLRCYVFHSHYLGAHLNSQAFCCRSWEIPCATIQTTKTDIMLIVHLTHSWKSRHDNNCIIRKHVGTESRRQMQAYRCADKKWNSSECNVNVLQQQPRSKPIKYSHPSTCEMREGTQDVPWRAQTYPSMQYMHLGENHKQHIHTWSIVGAAAFTVVQQLRVKPWSMRGEDSSLLVPQIMRPRVG